MLSAHFDSVPASPGATDDGAATAVMLQIARIMSRRETPSRNSLLLFFNNGEEIGLQGSRKLVNNPPEAWKPIVSNIKAFVNLEGGGAGGKPIMLRATTAKLAQAYANLPHPHMNSFGGDVLSFLGSDTDYTVYAGAGIPGLDVAYYENRRFYHSEQDSLDHITANDVQYMGDNILSITRTLLDADWIDDLKIESRIAFFDQFGFSPIVTTLPFQMALLGTILVGLLALLVYGYFTFFKQNEFQIDKGQQEQPTSSTTTTTNQSKYSRFNYHIGRHIMYISSAALMSLAWSIGLALTMMVISGFSAKATLGIWLLIPVTILGCIGGGYHTTTFFRASFDQNKDTPMQLYVGLVLGCVIAGFFVALNFPLMYLFSFGAIARLVAVAALNAYKNPNSENPISLELSPTTSLLVFGTIVAVTTFYPMILLLDFLISITNLGVGSYYLVLVFVMLCFPFGGSMFAVLVHVKSDFVGRVIKWGCLGLALGFTGWMMLLIF
ncbi:hypothetical protein BDR26DRAFT_860410 [Obelidium mucronatum]|nr:hypothetical protein BDR26DRAFT_860410 [Obelidium mucronatum]